MNQNPPLINSSTTPKIYMRIIREINRGGFGRVEEVEFPNGKRAARKIFSLSFLPACLEENQKLLKRFKREAMVQVSLNSSSFIPIIGDDLDGDQPHYIMPLAEKNLSQEIQEAKITGQAPQKALADILNALDELHELGYVHRDLKPANVLLHDGIWKLSDFGLVQPPVGTTTKLTSTDSNWGTTAYCAPEQAIEFRNSTAAVDIYAFGCILHDIYGTGVRVPYQRYSAIGEIGWIIEKCTELKPEKRFQSVRALRGALLTLLSSSPSITLSPDATDWITGVQNVENWDTQKLEDFVRFLSYSEDKNGKSAVLRNLTEDAFDHMFSIDTDLFKTLTNIYCEWIDGYGGFGWDFCDVLIRRLEKVFELGDIEIKAAAALTSAKLGYSHNRFFVMQRVLQLCGKSLDDTVARRITIEINAREAKRNFRECAKVIQRDINEYHPKIAQLLA